MDKDFERKYCSRTAEGFQRVGHDSIRSMKWMVFYDNHYENVIYFDLKTSVLSWLKETS